MRKFLKVLGLAICIPLLMASGFLSIVCVMVAASPQLPEDVSPADMRVIGAVCAVIMVLAAFGTWGCWRGLRKISAPLFHPVGMAYATVSQRVWAGSVDFLLCMPLIVPPFFLSNWTVLKFELWYLPTFLFYPYIIIMVGRYGQTLGKMALGIRVFQVDGRPAGWSHAVKRASGDIAIGLFLLWDHVTMVVNLEPGALDGKSYLQVLDEMSKGSLVGEWSAFLPLAWYMAEYVTMVFNRQRRAIHDYLGGTVILSLKSAAPAQVPAQ